MSTQGKRRRTRSPRRALAVGLVAVVAMGSFTVVMRRRGYSGFGGNTIVRCREGHLFTTIWVPGVSLKAVRLGLARFQRCPVGAHWTIVKPVKDDDLSEDERAFATQHRDVRIP